MTRAAKALLVIVVVAVAVLAAVPLPGQRVLGPRAAAGPTAGGSGGIVVVAAGDIACPPGSPATAAGCRQGATARAVLAQHPRAVLLLGDNQYKNGALWRYRASYAHSWGRFLRRTYPTPGNHEYRTKGAAWLRADLAAHPARCTLAFWHHPRFSSGSEGETMAVGRFWDALYAAGADVVLNGHDHDYERFAPQDPLGEPDPVNGIREFVAGTGGAPWLPLRAAPAANTQVRATATFGVPRLTLQPRGYAWRSAPC